MSSSLGTLTKYWRRFAPKAAVRILRLWRHGPRFKGDYSTWDEARGRCVGYDDQKIVDEIVAAARAVRAGIAPWERDGTLFEKPAVHRPLLDSLLDLAANEHQGMALIDFGGALGSTWWQHRMWLPPSQFHRWDIVEQTALVQHGRAEFNQPPLRFFSSLDEACRDGPPHAILFSSVLQYLPDPFDILREVNQRGFRYVVFDRTGFTNYGRHRLTIQSNGSIVRTARCYPCWFFNQSKLFGDCLPDFQLCKEWQGFDCSNLKDTVFSGGVLIRKNEPNP